MNFEQFGGKIKPRHLEQYQRSPNWQDGVFRNQPEITTAPGWREMPSMLYKQIKGKKDNVPKAPLPIDPLSDRFNKPSDEPLFVWYGHSNLVAKIENKVIALDPMFGPDCSPIAPFQTKRFSENTLSLIDDLPPIDVVLISHDHYDHLDLESIKRIKAKVKRYIVALGVKRHLIRWGISEHMIQEMDWYESIDIDNLKLTFTPTQHFSGRGLTDRSKSLWGGWVIESKEHKIWFSGDSGYCHHFEEIGQKFGPFDIGCMECGQYNPDWPDLHMFPEQSVRAAQKAGVRLAMPIHWGGFPLSYHHTWYDPVENFTRYAEENGLDYITPPPGAIFTIDTSASLDRWWEKHK